MLIKLVGSFL